MPLEKPTQKGILRTATVKLGAFLQISLLSFLLSRPDTYFPNAIFVQHAFRQEGTHS